MKRDQAKEKEPERSRTNCTTLKYVEHVLSVERV